MIEEISSLLVLRMNRKDEPADAFICSSHLKEIWKSGCYLDDLLWDNHLTAAQLDVVKTRLLEFVSCLIWIGVDNWFAKFRERVFYPPDSTTLTTGLADDMPLSRPVVESLGIRPSAVEGFLQDQYRFIPATLEFSDDHEAEQSFSNKSIRLPFLERESKEYQGGFGTVKVHGAGGTPYRLLSEK